MHTVSRGPAVIVMARAPVSGEGKTRLRTVLSDQECLKLQEAFVHETVQVALDAAVGPVFLAFTPAKAAAWADRTFGTKTKPFPQPNQTTINKKGSHNDEDLKCVSQQIPEVC